MFVIEIYLLFSKKLSKVFSSFISIMLVLTFFSGNFFFEIIFIFCKSGFFLVKRSLSLNNSSSCKKGSKVS